MNCDINDSCRMSWDIIIWKTENCIDYVPSVWSNVDNTLYKYPTNRSETKIRQAIYECEDISHNYKWCEAIAKKRGITNLRKARELCMKGQYSSHISDNTEEEQILPSKRKIFKRILDEYDYDEDELPPTQKVNSNSQQQECTFKVPIPVTSTFSEGCMKNKNYGVNNTDREIKKREADLKKQPPVLYQDDSDEDDASSVYMRRKNYYEVPNLVGDGFEVAVVDETVADNQAEVEDHCKDSDDATISGLSSTSTITNYSNLNSDDILKEILRNQVDIKYSLKNLTKRIDQIDNVLKFTRGADVKSLEESPIISKLPSGNVQDLLILENYIKETENFSNLVNFLYLVGGETEAKTIYYILRKLITNDVALQYSGIGKKGKLAFCKLDIYRAIVAATRMRHAKVTDEYIKKTVSTYLAQAKSRISNK